MRYSIFKEGTMWLVDKLKIGVLSVLVYAEILIYLVVQVNATAWSWKWWGWGWAIAIHILIDLIYCIVKLYMNPALYHHLVKIGVDARKKWDATAIPKEKVKQ